VSTTYEPIATTTLSTTSAVEFSFNSIPATYTDLIITAQVSAQYTSADNSQLCIRFNGDTGTNYSQTYINGDGSSATSGRASNTSTPSLGNLPLDTAPSATKNLILIHIMNYSNTTTYKTWMFRNNRGSLAVRQGVGLWRSTAAINSVSLRDLPGLYNLHSGSIFTLWGIASA